MSLINEMLRDIAKNKKTVEAKPINFGCIGRTSYSRPLKVILFKTLYSIIILNFIIIAGLFIYKLKAVTHKKKTANIQLYNSVIPSISNVTFNLNPIKKKPIQTKATIIKDENLNNKIGRLVSKQKESFFIKKYKPLNKRQYSKQQYKKAMLLNDEGIEQEKIIAMLQSILDKDPTFVDARQTLSGLFLELNLFKQANETIAEGLIIQPNNLNFIEVKAQLLLSKGKASEALTILKRISPLISDEPAYYNLMAVAFEKTGQLALAGAIYQQLIKIQPSNGAYWFGLALSLEAKLQINQAIGAYKKVIGAYNSSPIIISYAKDRITALG